MLNSQIVNEIPIVYIQSQSQTMKGFYYIDKNAGKNICGMIRYTYFEDFTLPPIGWKVKEKKLLEDYYPKVTQDVKSGKISKDSKEDKIIEIPKNKKDN